MLVGGGPPQPHSSPGSPNKPTRAVLRGLCIRFCSKMVFLVLRPSGKESMFLRTGKACGGGWMTARAHTHATWVPFLYPQREAGTQPPAPGTQQSDGSTNTALPPPLWVPRGEPGSLPRPPPFTSDKACGLMRSSGEGTPYKVPGVEPARGGSPPPRHSGHFPESSIQAPCCFRGSVLQTCQVTSL